MHPVINRLKTWISQTTLEESTTLSFLESIPHLKRKTVLDVGCGQGRFLTLMKDLDLNITGVEINPHLRKALLQKGLPVLSPEEFSSSSIPYDVILFSHIIEHFTPNDLMAFLQTYLSRLKPGGYFLILTPLMNPDFFDDYDHVKPYSPTAVCQLFSGQNEAQIQAILPVRATLKSLWFRKTPFRFKFYPSAFLKTGVLIRSLNLFLALLFQLSFRTLGKKDAWIGLFRRDDT